MRESLGSNMEKYTCVLEERNSRLSITYNFSPKIIFRQLWKACQKLWKVLAIFILCFKLDSTKISHFNNNKCKSTREKSDEKVMRQVIQHLTHNYFVLCVNKLHIVSSYLNKK